MRYQRHRHSLGPILFFGIILLFSCPCTGRAEGEAAKEALKLFLGTIRSIEFPVRDSAHHENLVRQAHRYLDLESMVKVSLISHWDGINIEDRAAFLDLMWKLVEKVAYARSRSFLGEVEITYPELKEIDRGWSVKSIVAGKEEGLDAEVTYYLYDQEGRWKIYDVILDDVSMTEDLRYQFDKIIGESSFSGLLDRMQDRLEKADKKNQGDTS